MKQEQKLGLTEFLLAIIGGLSVWQTQLLLELSEEVARLQVHDKDQDRRIERLEESYESSAPYFTPLHDRSADLHGAGT